MWSSRDDISLQKASDDASQIILVASAQKAGIFKALASEKSISELKEELRCDKRALYIVLEALNSFGYVDKKGERYVISGRSKSLFSGIGCAGGFLPHFLNIMKAWLELPDLLKGVKPEKKPEHRDVPAFMDAMASRPDNIVKESVEHCVARKGDAEKVLDLGGGPGKYSRAFVGKGLKAVLYDTPDVIDYVSEKFRLKDVEHLYLKRGDFNTGNLIEEFAGDLFDIVFMGNICHMYSEAENKNLITRVGHILTTGGMIAIEDFVRGRSPAAEMFAVNMLANTEEGNTYTEDEYKNWLEGAGFTDIEVVDLADRETQLITAVK